MEFYIISEFYASGNIIFTSADYKILTLLYPYTYETKIDTSQEVGEENKIQVKQELE